jgi:predicted metal-dependent hydrolase
MTETYIHSDFGEILIHHSQKAKSIRIQVGINGIKLTIPLASNIKKGLQFIDTKKTWIEQSLQKMQQKKESSHIDITTLKAQTFSIETKESNRTNILFRLQEGLLTIEHPSSLRILDKEYQGIIIDGIEKFVIAEAKKQFSKRLAYLAEKYEFTYNSLRIQRAQTRWGSCSSKKNINLSAYLLFVPEYLSDYVLIHELCHTKEMNHSSRFWGIVARIEPNYMAYRKELKHYGSVLHLFNRK